MSHFSDDDSRRRCTDGGQHLLEWARRRVPGPLPESNAVGDLLDGKGDAEVAARRGLPMAAIRGLRSFYDELGHETEVCDGTACHLAGGAQLAEGLRSAGSIRAVRCLGHCFAAPSFRRGDSVFTRPPTQPTAEWLNTVGASPPPPPAPSAAIPRTAMADPPVVLRNLTGSRSHPPLDEYDLPDGDTILSAVEHTRLRGPRRRGFPDCRQMARRPRRSWRRALRRR